MFITKANALRITQYRFGLCKFHELNPSQEEIARCKNCLVIIDPCGCDGDMGCDVCCTKEVTKFMEDSGGNSFLEAVNLSQWEQEKRVISHNYDHKSWHEREERRKNKARHTLNGTN